VRCDVLTIFPEFFDSPLAVGLLGKAVQRGLLEVRRHDLRDWTHDRHRTVDDAPFGGGAGMVMRPEPWFEALDELLAEGPARVILLAPDGRRLDQPAAVRLALEPRLVLCCGRYEGVDERVRTRVDEVLSVGDFVLAGGETAALVVLEALARLLPGVMGNASSAAEESFSAGLLEYPQYTRPAVYRDLEVPEVLRSGNHGAIARWRRDRAIERTRQVRPDLLAGAELTEEERARHGLDSAPEPPGGPVE
jgi:tRNA (guanine37-N1)-methyltransferase